jgi:hypothetical protein
VNCGREDVGEGEDYGWDVRVEGFDLWGQQGERIVFCWVFGVLRIFWVDGAAWCLKVEGYDG